MGARPAIISGRKSRLHNMNGYKLYSKQSLDQTPRIRLSSVSVWDTDADWPT